MINILLVEDEEVLGHLIREVLTLEPDFRVAWIKDGASAIENALAAVPDICILDVMLPQVNGFNVAKALRKHYENLPIIFLSARSSASDVIKGFESGGNDYLRKPFSIKELKLRVKTLLSHSNFQPANILEHNSKIMLGLYAYCTVTNTLSCGQNNYVLTSREGEVLKELILHRNQVMQKDAILLKIWGMNTIFTSRTLDVYIGRIRKYLVHDPSISIKNIRGYGYKLVLGDTL